MANLVKKILAKPIQLADQVIQAADEAILFNQECAELKSKSEKLVVLLGRASNELYQRPMSQIIDDTGQALERDISIVRKCSAD